MFLTVNFAFLLSFFLLSMMKKMKSFQIPFILLFMGFIPFIRNESLVFEGLGGIHLVFDDDSRLFVLMNSLVFLGVSLKMMCTKDEETHPFSLMLTFMTLNFLFVSCDLFNMFVLLELLSMETMILISSGRKLKQFWSSIKYMIVGSVGMNFYLIGTGIIYMENGTFDLARIAHVSNMALVLIFSGLLMRTGFFLYGMWLPSAHSCAENIISAVLSGTIVKGGIFVLLRILNCDPFKVIAPWITKFSAVSAFLAVLFTMSLKNYKRMLAYSTLSQLGFVMSNLSTASLYAFAHGLFKSWLFLIPNGSDSSRKCEFPLWIFMLIASFSIIGIPGTIAYPIKTRLIGEAGDFEKIFLKLAVIGTTATFSRFILRKPVFKVKTNLKDNLYNLYFSILIIGAGFLILKKFEFEVKSLIQTVALIIIGVFIYLIVKDRITIEKNIFEKIEMNIFIVSLLILGMILWSIF